MNLRRLFALFAGLLLFIVVAVSITSAANVDTSLFKQKPQQLLKKYDEIYKAIKASGGPDTQVQLTIIKTLKSVLRAIQSRPKVNVEFKPLSNQNDFLRLFKQIAALIVRYNSMDNRIEELDRKLKVLKESIASAKGSDPHLLTYNLQYALYMLTRQKLKQEKKEIAARLKLYKGLLYRAFLKIRFDDASAPANIKRLKEKLRKLDDYIQSLNIEEDRLTLLGQSSLMRSVEEKLARAQKKRDDILMQIIDNVLIIQFKHIKLNTSPDMKAIDKWEKKLSSPELKRLTESEKDLLYYIAKLKLGSLRTFAKQIQGGAGQIATMIWHFVTKPLFHVGSGSVSIFNLVIALIVFVLGIYTGKLYKIRIRESRFARKITLSTRTIIANVGYYTIILITFLIGLKIIGLNLSSLTVILGALSVGIGFGLQNMVSNFISGIILMLENSIRIGDYIEISDTLKGVVRDIQMRSTTIVTNDNIEVIIPNQTLFQNNVINWTLTEKLRRFRIPFSVAYGTKIEDVEKAVLGALEKSSLNYVRHIKGKEPELKMTAMADSGVDFDLDVWVEGDDVLYPRRTISRFLILIYNALYENGIEIPFPQMDLHFRNSLEVEYKRRRDNSN